MQKKLTHCEDRTRDLSLTPRSIGKERLIHWAKRVTIIEKSRNYRLCTPKKADMHTHTHTQAPLSLFPSHTHTHRGYTTPSHPTMTPRIPAPASTSRVPPPLRVRRPASTPPLRASTSAPPSTSAPSTPALLSLLSSLAVLAASPAAAAALDYTTTGSSLDLERYSGMWYEVASLKEGFAGEGQKDCHCTAGLYVPARAKETGEPLPRRLAVKTFCVHGSPTGKISGIQGRVSCPDGRQQQQQQQQECKLTFPSIPFIPGEPYEVLETDYDSFALVEGARDKTFVQVYSRTPNPGKAFVSRQIKHLEQDYG